MDDQHRQSKQNKWDKDQNPANIAQQADPNGQGRHRHIHWISTEAERSVGNNLIGWLIWVNSGSDFPKRQQRPGQNADSGSHNRPASYDPSRCWQESADWGRLKLLDGPSTEHSSDKEQRWRKMNARVFERSFGHTLVSFQQVNVQKPQNVLDDLPGLRAIVKQIKGMRGFRVIDQGNWQVAP